MKSDSEGLHKIANTEKPDRLADIVFIHGLRGASHSTWRHGKEGEQDHFFWPEKLGKDLLNCGIWSVGYPAGLTELGQPGMIIEKRAGNISHKLATAGLGHHPLLFVTHSMGGLIVKSLIVDSQTLPDVDRKRIVSMVCGIVFCGTPHKGSAFADAADVLGKFFGGSQKHVKQMYDNAEPLDILHDEFIEWQHNHDIPIESYAESIGLFYKRWFWYPLRLDPVVPRASANPGIAGHTVRDVDDDHLTLVKPPNCQHDVYAGVLRFIRNTLKVAPLSPASATVATTVQSRSSDIANLMGTWNVCVKDYHGKWTFLEDGTVLSTAGTKEGKWILKKTRVFIQWNPEHWETLNCPLNVTPTSGDSWQGDGLVVARKIQLEETFFRMVQGKWHLDYSVGQEDLRIDSKGDYHLISAGRETHYYTIENLVFDPASNRVAFDKVDTGQFDHINRPKGQCFRRDMLEIASDGRTMTGFDNKDCRLIYTRVD